MKLFDIAPFALPNGPAGELVFEEARDIDTVEVVVAGPAPADARLEYKRKVWPHTRIERPGDLDQVRPMSFGGQRMDDMFTPAWVEAATNIVPLDAHTLRFTFQPLRNETPDFPDADLYDVTFRRTVGVRVVGSEVPIQSLRVELHAGCRT